MTGTQYRVVKPDGTEQWFDDVKIGQAVLLLYGLRRGDCWCDVGIGNPMMSSHDKVCDEVRAFLGEERP